MTSVKICGLTRESDIEEAIRAGADRVGFVLVPTSPRHISPEALAIFANRTYHRRLGGWAQVWAQQVTVDEAQRRSLQDVRAPGQWRGNGPIMQQGAFGAAYGCKAGTPMQPKPEQRIAIFR